MLAEFLLLPLLVAYAVRVNAVYRHLSQHPDPAALAAGRAFIRESLERDPDADPTRIGTSAAMVLGIRHVLIALACRVPNRNALAVDPGLDPAADPTAAEASPGERDAT